MLVYEFMAKGNLRDNLLGEYKYTYMHAYILTHTSCIHRFISYTYKNTHMICTGVHPYIDTYIYPHAYTHTNKDMRMYVQTCRHTYTYRSIYANKDTYMQFKVHTYKHISIYTYKNICIHINNMH